MKRARRGSRPAVAAAVLALAAWLGVAAYAEDTANRLSAEEAAAGWTLLFDGRSVDQWRAYGGATVPRQWQIEDDALVLTEAGGGDLVTRAIYGDFELQLDWRIAIGGNSGIFVLADETDKPIYVHAPEVQILDDARHPDGADPKRRSGSLYDLIAAPAASQRPAGEWNTVRIRHVQGHLQAWQNGIATIDVEIGSQAWARRVAASKFASWSGFAANRSGHVGLQDHGDRVAFRNLKIRAVPK